MNLQARWGSILLALALCSMAEAGEPAAALVTHHSGVFNRQQIDYTASVASTLIHDDAGRPALRLVTTAYVRPSRDASQRPVLFLFNGGPSSSSATLHMLAFGPKRIAVPQDPRTAMADTPSLMDNGSTVLDAADLVFIDPAESGFSRALGGTPAAFYATDSDAQSIARFIEVWVKTHGREQSPKYLLGESYGTIRAALMAGMLAERMPLHGIILFGQAVNMIETSQRAGNAIGYATNLPALATAAAYHGRAARGDNSMQTFIDEVYEWSMREYLPALVAGRDLPASARRRIARRLQALTGISADYYLSHGLIISKLVFARELLKDKGLIVSQYDARYVGPAPAAGERAADPFGKIMNAVLPMLRSYLSESLAVPAQLDEYRGFAPDTDQWRWPATGGIGGPFWDYDYQAELAKAFAANEHCRLLIGTGIYDLTTTVGPARYLLAQSNYPMDRVYQRQYAGGHMAYTNQAALIAFMADVRALLKGEALPQRASP